VQHLLTIIIEKSFSIPARLLTIMKGMDELCLKVEAQFCAQKKEEAWGLLP
jgi:hypothetical protein